MRKIFLAFLFMLMATPALADNVANVELGCAPYDGRALNVTIG